ncbi:MAG: glycoside hydrolase family 140 protein [Bacteroidetes bacterium]|nr:glycoside hydrolase family 140 protein [Bacteroidota bacterium]
MKKIATIFFLFNIAYAQIQPLQISSNHRFFQTKDGKPFFWQGDTGWLLFIKCTREEAVKYLDDRQQKGYNVIQVMLVHDINKAVNLYGDSAIQNKNLAQPVTTPGNNFYNAAEYDYWDHVDYVIDEAAKRGIYMALVPVWGGNIKHVTEAQAKVYAAFLANRYKNKTNIIWLNGGDIKGTDGLAQWNAIGNTIRSIDKNHLISFHPRGRNSSSAWFHQQPWLDFNMIQSGHKDYAQDTVSTEKLHYGEDNWKYIVDDYKLQPVKPTLDGEPSYENIPHGLHDSLEKRWTADDIRRYAYWEVLAGGAGFTYGNNSVMQFYHKGDKESSFGANANWEEELNAPGAAQIQYLKQLMLSHDYFSRRPAQEIVLNDGTRYDKIIAAKGSSYVYVYTYNARDVKLALNKVNFKPAKATWFSPADSQVIAIKNFKYTPVQTFSPPGEKKAGNDWVLILER